MLTEMETIPMRETLHFLGWHGTPIEPELLDQIREKMEEARAVIRPHVIIRRFRRTENGMLEGTSFSPEGEDVRKLLCTCKDVFLLAATLGAQSERLLLKQQAKDATQALLMDAVLSAAIESVCDAQENAWRTTLKNEGLFLTDRFSPGYGDMPLTQSASICAVLNTEKAIGLTVSKSGIMIPRKSVTAVMGISTEPVVRRATGCACCNMKETCALRSERP